MKLNETIQLDEPLFESFNDLKRILRNTFISTLGDDEITFSNVSNFEEEHPKAYDQFMEFYDEIETAKIKRTSIPINADPHTVNGCVEIVKWIVKHPYVANEHPKLKDTGVWIRSLRNGDLKMFFTSVKFLTKQIVKYESQPQKQKPDMDVIKKTSKYEVYRLNNFAAAKKVCNTFKTNFCIGADSGWFDNYGESRGRDTYAITLPNKTVVIVHSGASGFLITDHSNQNDISHTGVDRGAGAKAIADDFKKAGLTQEEAIEALMNTVKRSFHMNIVNLIEKGYDDETNKIIYKRQGLIVEEIGGGENAAIRFGVDDPDGQNYYVIPINESALLISANINMTNFMRASPNEVITFLRGIGFDGRSLRAIVATMYNYGGEAQRISKSLGDALNS